MEVYVDAKKAREDEESDDVEIEAREGHDIYKIDVWMAGSRHFVIDDPKTGVLTLDRRKHRSDPVPFQVRVANKIDDSRGAVLFAYFTYEGRPSGQVSKMVKLGPVLPCDPRPETPPPTPPASGFRIAPGLPRADITVEITDPEGGYQHLKCRVSSGLLGSEEQPAPEDWRLSEKSGDLVAEYMKEFVDDQNHRAYSLIGAGDKLYKGAPKSFQKVLWELIDRGTPPKTILINSQEPFIPWELMIPSRPGPGGDQRKALGVEFQLGRWTRNDHGSPPVEIPLKRSCVVAPNYLTEPEPLPNSDAEVTMVLLAVPGVQVNPAILTNITAQLDSEAPSLVHFVCHGAAEIGKGVQAIYLHHGKERLTSLEVTAIPSIRKAFKHRPLVFLNACEVGRPAVALTGIGGFAAAFLELGAAAVIAPLWSVKDDVAFDVATRFYQAATAASGVGPRKTFSAIMQEVRDLAYDPVTGDDTYAAYCFYGDPNAIPT